jgi:hypothetical protein
MPAQPNAATGALVTVKSDCCIYASFTLLKNISNVKICSACDMPHYCRPDIRSFDARSMPGTDMTTYSGNYPDIKPAYDLSYPDQVDQ